MTWLKQIDQNAEQDITKILVANKIDLPNRIISSEKGQELADAHGLAFFETSAKTGENIDIAFQTLENKIKERRNTKKRQTKKKSTKLIIY